MKKQGLQFFKDLISQAVQLAGFKMKMEEIHLEETKTLEHGHFSTNIAMILAKSLKKPPREVAQMVFEQLESEIIKKVEIAGPGFINLWVEQKFYTEESKLITQDLSTYLNSQFEKNRAKTMVIDYSHPNIAKPMGAHHLLSTIIGDSIKKIYLKNGWKVIADNFIGDMGTQFGKLMHAIKNWGNWDEIEKNPIKELQKLYVQFHVEAEKNEELDQEGRVEYKKFEGGDPEARNLWEKIRKWSLAEIQPIYDRLDIHFDQMNGESFYEDKMRPILQAGQQKGIIVEGEKGALIVPPDEPEETPVLLQKSDGTTLYATRDLARIQYWEKEWSPDLMLTVVDSAQSFHFQQVFLAALKLGLTRAQNVHVGFGRMQFKDGKMSTRKGNILLLTEVLDEAEERALEQIKGKGTELSELEQAELAKIMGINSIKYNILCQNRTTNITFDWDKMLSFEGNSAPYLMYTLARAHSVLRKTELKVADLRDFELNLGLEIEQKIAIQLLIYPETIERAAEEFKPNLVANYLYELASNFNHFYNGNSILQAESEALKNSRLLLAMAVVKIMEDGFSLLGMKSVQKM